MNERVICRLGVPNHQLIPALIANLYDLDPERLRDIACEHGFVAGDPHPFRGYSDRARIWYSAEMFKIIDALGHAFCKIVPYGYFFGIRSVGDAGPCCGIFKL